MKTIIKLLCLLCLVIFAWSAPALKSSADLSFGGSIKAVDICPKVKCMAVKQPCANIQRYYTVINGQKCPMCPYCASSTTQQP